MGTAVAKESSTGKQSAWLDATIDKLWERFENRYGSLWMDRWAGLPMVRVKAEWSDELRGFTPDALRYGFDAVKDGRFPPTLPEFVEACRRAPKPRLVALDAPPIPQEKLNARLAEIGKFCQEFGRRPGNSASDGEPA